jgi:hypothetical protein
MITVNQLRDVLENHRDSELHIMLPSGEFVPGHFHITEVGRVQKTFIDCGGTCRESVACVLQVWTAQDVDHRLSAGKLAKILSLADTVLGQSDLLVEIEYGTDSASQYLVADVEVTPSGLLFVLAGKHTDCLAKDKCGVGETCCTGNGCCQ